MDVLIIPLDNDVNVRNVLRDLEQYQANCVSRGAGRWKNVKVENAFAVNLHPPGMTKQEWGDQLDLILSGKVGTLKTIGEPPCRLCDAFNPTVEFEPTNKGRKIKGLRCCWREDSFADYSCFAPREEESSG